MLNSVEYNADCYRLKTQFLPNMERNDINTDTIDKDTKAV